MNEKKLVFGCSDLEDACNGIKSFRPDTTCILVKMDRELNVEHNTQSLPCEIVDTKVDHDAEPSEKIS